MSAGDTETIRQMWEEIAAGLPEETAWKAAIERWWHPELLYEEDPKWPGAGAYRGRDEVRAVFEGYAEVMGTATFSVEEIAASDDDAVVLVRVKGDSAAGVPWDHVWDTCAEPELGSSSTCAPTGTPMRR